MIIPKTNMDISINDSPRYPRNKNILLKIKYSTKNRSNNLFVTLKNTMKKKLIIKLLLSGC